MEVVIGSGDIDQAILLLRKKVQASGIQRELRIRCFPKPSERLKAKRQDAEAKRRRKRRNGNVNG
jgi:ribosomal protein S21